MQPGLKTKKPAAGGGATGFPKRTEQRLGGGAAVPTDAPWEESGPSEFEALREEVHRFDENQDSHSRRTLNSLRCSAAM